MAQIFLCDNSERHATDTESVPAEVLVTRIENGEVNAWCGPCFIDLCVAVARQAESQSAQPDAPATATDDTDEDDDSDEDAVRRLNIVKKGTSRSRRDYEQRKRVKSDPEAQPETDAAPASEPESDGVAVA